MYACSGRDIVISSGASLWFSQACEFENVDVQFGGRLYVSSMCTIRNITADHCEAIGYCSVQSATLTSNGLLYMSNFCNADTLILAGNAGASFSAEADRRTENGKKQRETVRRGL